MKLKPERSISITLKIYNEPEIVNVKIIDKNNVNITLGIDLLGNIILKGKNITNEKALEVIKEYQKWIEKTYLSMKKKVDYLLLDKVKAKEKIWYFGNIYNLHLSISDKTIVTSNDIYTKSNNTELELFNLGKERITCLFEKYAQIFNLEPILAFKSMKSKHGYCLFNKNKIVLSTKMIYLPIETIEYVIVHEFMHFFIHNHSAYFYERISYYLPDYKERIKLIKKFNPLFNY